MEGEKETNFYSDERGGHITNARAIVGATTYSMANITSVSMAVKPADRTAGIALIIVGFIILAIFAGMVIPGGIVFGVILLGVGIMLVATAKATYKVRIASASGEVDAISSKDKEYIQAIVQAIEEAFIKRG